MLVGYAARGKTTLLQKITEKGKRGVQENWGLQRYYTAHTYHIHFIVTIILHFL